MTKKSQEELDKCMYGFIGGTPNKRMLGIFPTTLGMLLCMLLSGVRGLLMLPGRIGTSFRFVFPSIHVS